MSTFTEEMLELGVLPDFPKSKADVLRLITRRIKALETEQHPVLARIKTYRHHEGVITNFEQVGFGRKSQSAAEHSVPVDLRNDEIPSLIGEALEMKMRVFADQLGGLKMKQMFARINEATEQTGQRLDTQGKSIDGAMLLELMDMAEGAFDKAGKLMNSFLIHPDMLPSLKKAFEEVESDPELKRRLNSIKRQHYQQWVDRESRRKLVD